MAFADAPSRPIFMLLDSTKVYDCVPPFSSPGIFGVPVRLPILGVEATLQLSEDARHACSPHMSNVYMYIYICKLDVAAIGLFRLSPS